MSGYNYIGASGVRKIKAWVKSLVPTKLSQLANDPGYITSAGVTGVKGSAESSYRTGNVSLTAANVGAAAADHTHSGYAAASHTHSEYAAASHTHSEYAAASHGNHVPATQTADNAKFLRNDNTWQKVTPANIGAAASGHTHSEYAAASHTHDYTKTRVKGDAEASYRTGDVNLTPANIGAASSSHAHSASDITSGTLAVDRLPGIPTYYLNVPWSGNEAAAIAAVPSRPSNVVYGDGYEVAYMDDDATTDTY